MATTGAPVSATARLHAAFSKPLYARCLDVAKILEDTSLKELHTILPLLLENVFGFNNLLGWSLHRITLAQGQDFHDVRRLLSPRGPLFSVIYKLMQDPHCRYEFPVSCLPYPSRRMLEEGGIPVLYADKLQFMQGYGRPYNMLLLNAYEYYFFHFTYMLVNPNLTRGFMWSAQTEYLYAALADDYMNYFLPLNGHVAPAPSYAMSPMSSPMASPLSRTPQSPGLLSRYSGLPSLLSNTAQTQTISENQEQLTARSYCLLQILVEFWLNQTVTDAMLHSSTSHVMENFLPHEPHVRMVRMLVKHLHYFTYSVKSHPATSPYSHSVVSPMEEFKRVAFNQLVQKKLYSFLRHGFEKWPLDSSFRTLMETWLSTIQPWRYVDPRRRENEKCPYIQEKWRSFITENLLFYTVLFHQFLYRVFRMDLSAPNNAHMIYRTSKIFSINNLADMIQEVETSLFESSNALGRSSMWPSDLGGSYLSPSNKAAVLNLQFSELEGPGFKYHPMFSESSVNHVRELLGLLQQVKAEKMSDPGKGESGKESWWSWLGFSSLPDYNTPSSYTDYDDYNHAESRRSLKLLPNIEDSIKNLCAIFKIEQGEEVEHIGWRRSTAKPGRQDAAPDVIHTADGVQLSPLGKYQVMNGLRRFDIQYTGDPDLQPVRSYEYVMLVRLLYHVAQFFNEKYGDQIAEVYERPDMIGNMAYHLLQPPITNAASSPVLKKQTPAPQRARVSLRWLASRRNIYSLLIVSMFFYFYFGFNGFSIVLIYLCGTLFYAFIMGLIFPKPKVKYS